jgi:two-component system response regulator
LVYPNVSADLLLVEDSPDDVELTLRAFRTARLANPVIIARDGAEALELLFGSNGRQLTVLPRVVLLDLKLPKVSGLEVLARIRADERTKKLAVVVLTSSREEPDIARAYELGVNSYIVKPVEFDKFVFAVSHVGLYWLLMNQPPS